MINRSIISLIALAFIAGCGLLGIQMQELVWKNYDAQKSNQQTYSKDHGECDMLRVKAGAGMGSGYVDSCMRARGWYAELPPKK